MKIELCPTCSQAVEVHEDGSRRIPASSPTSVLMGLEAIMVLPHSTWRTDEQKIERMRELAEEIYRIVTGQGS